MVLLNNKPVEYINFPDGTVKIDIDEEELEFLGGYMIEWRYENDAEFMLVAFTKMHLADKPWTKNTKVTLRLSYIPNARFDRVNSDSEVFTLKHFAKLINTLDFDEVEVLDPHSRVAECLIDHINIGPVADYIETAIDYIADENDIDMEDVVLFFPDEGAQKRYMTGEFNDYVPFFGNKVREWKSGHILGLNIETHTDKGLDYLKDKTVLIIDDIISAGGTVYYSIKELEKYGIKNVYAYCSHLENTMFTQPENKLREMLEDKNSVFEHIYTTNSIYNQEHEKVTVLDVI